jgi:flagellar motor switch protein FliN/FliY
MSTSEPENGKPSLPSLDLLLDVELEATIRFGGRHLALREILSMSVGSVVELDKRIDEPAELLVAGRLIAMGEVVVVDGSFGLRVTQVVSAPETAELLQQ